MTRSSTQHHTYQVSELQRSYRSIVRDAREGGRALIRDKDGTTLSLMPAADAERDAALRGHFLGFIQLTEALRAPRGQRTVTSLGQLAWASSLDDDDLAEFAMELTQALMVATSGGPLSSLEELLHDWQVTAAVAADADIAEDLLAEEDAPLADVAL